MNTSKISLSLTLITILLVGASTSETGFAAGGGHGGGAGRGGGGGHGGGGGWRGGGGGGWHGGGRVGIYLGVPFGFNYGYYPYSYYGSPYYGVPNYYSTAPAYYSPMQSAPIYTEQSDDPQISAQVAPKNSAQATEGSWWYYCADTKAYYPYVNQCPGGWLRVSPQPAPGSDSQPALNNVPAP